MKPCNICEQPGAGNHFGVNSCRACAAFFRRGALRKSPYTCKNEVNIGRCDIFNTTTEQYYCKKCRLDKCLKVGMSVKRFQFGRDWIVPSEEPPKKTPKADSEPKFLHLVNTKRKKNFIELKYLLQAAENILLNYKPISTKSPISTLLTLTHATNSVRNHPSLFSYSKLTRWGVEEKLKDWETSFFTVAKWFTYFDEFQKLPISTRMEVFTGVWHVWVLFDKLALNCIAKRNGFAENENILIAGYNTYFDLSNLKVEMTDFSRSEEEIGRRFVTSIDWNMMTFIKPLLDLNPDDVELTFMISQFCFNYAGKRFQGEIQKITEKFQEILANDLHNYYVNDQNNMRYAVRLGKLMKFVRSMENDFLEKQRKVEVGEVFDVWKLEFSHPEVFRDSFC